VQQFDLARERVKVGRQPMMPDLKNIARPQGLESPSPTHCQSELIAQTTSLSNVF